MARLAYRFAIASARVTAVTIEAQSFPELAQHYGVRSVPHTVINDQESVVGAVSEATLLAAVGRALAE